MLKKWFFTALVIITVLALAPSATGCASKDPEPLWEAGKARDKIVVISDIHLGLDDKYSETVKNRPYLVDFLDRIAQTKDVSELVLNGDIFDEWYLPLSYVETDRNQLYEKVAANNQIVIDALKKVMDAGVKLVYVPGNHDMTVSDEFIDKILPGIEQARDSAGLGTYRTGSRHEIAIEHSHRYDVFSAPDSITNAAITDGNTMLPPGYFYARYAADWVISGKSSHENDYPDITDIPDKESNPDQYSAYIYYKALYSVFSHITPGYAFDAKIFNIQIDGYHGSYSLQDLFPVLNEKGEISAPLLYPDYQRTWEARQEANLVKAKVDFATAALGALDDGYLEVVAREQYLVDSPGSDTEVVIFGHSHIPALYDYGNGRYCLNTGTWIDENTRYVLDDNSYLDRTFAVVTIGDTDSTVIYQYLADGSLRGVNDMLLADHE